MLLLVVTAFLLQKWSVILKAHRFLITASLLVILIIIISACGRSSASSTSQNQSQPHPSDNPNNSSNISHSSGDSSPSQQSTESPNNSNEKGGSEEVFYGQWQIYKITAFGPAGTYSTDDIQTLTGKVLTFTKDRATCFGEHIEDMNRTVTHPIYKKTVIPRDDLPSNYRVTLDQLGINDDSITEVDAKDTKGYCAVFFITPDNNKLLLYGGGTFFGLDKLSNTNNLSSDEHTELKTEEDNQNRAVSLVKEYLREKNELEQDENHFVQFEEVRDHYYIVRYSTLVSGHSSTNGRYAVDINKGTVADITED